MTFTLKRKRDCRSAAVSFLREGKASPFGRGVTEGDGEGKPGKIEPLCSDKQTFCQSEPSPRSKFFYQRPCPLRRFAPALPKGEPLETGFDLQIDLRTDTFKIPVDIAIGKAKHFQTISTQYLTSLLIVTLTLLSIMLRAVDFNN